MQLGHGWHLIQRDRLRQSPVQSHPHIGHAWPVTATRRRLFDQAGQRHIQHLGELGQHGEGGQLLAMLDLVQVVGRDAGQAGHHHLCPVVGHTGCTQSGTDHPRKLFVHPFLPSQRSEQHRSYADGHWS
jgi:hypothetical protein